MHLFNRIVNAITCNDLQSLLQLYINIRISNRIQRILNIPYIAYEVYWLHCKLWPPFVSVDQDGRRQKVLKIIRSHKCSDSSWQSTHYIHMYSQASETSLFVPLFICTNDRSKSLQLCIDRTRYRATYSKRIVQGLHTAVECHNGSW